MYLIGINYVKFASGAKNIHFDFTHIHRCVLALYTRYFPELCEKNHRHITWGLAPTIFASRAV